MNLNTPLEEMQMLLIRQRYLQDKYGITNNEIYDTEYWMKSRLMKHNKKIMNEEIKKYPIFTINKNGKMLRIFDIQSTGDYNHYFYNLHHFIPFSDYSKNQQWYTERGLEQKLILMSITLHEQIHNQAVKVLSDEEFEKKYKISKWNLIFNRKFSKYKEIGEE